MAGKITIEAGDSAGEQVRASLHELFQQSLLAGMTAAEDRAGHRAARAGGDRDILSCGNGDESSSVPVEPNITRFAGVSARFTSIPSAAPTGIPASMTADARHRR